MNRHNVVIHEGKESFECNICNPKFEEKRYLNRQSVAIYEGKKSFECRIFDTLFAPKNSLDGHVASIQKGKKLCNICDTKFIQKTGLSVSFIHEKTLWM